MSMSNLIGTTAVETIGALLSVHPQIVELMLFEPAPVLLAQDRLRESPESQSIIDAGLETRRKHGFPFWDAVLAATFGQGRAGFPIVEKALFHNCSISRRILVRSRDWSGNYVNSMIRDISPGRILVLSSLVKLNSGERRHIPFIDFHCSSSAKNEDLCSHAANLLDPKGGYLLESGQSYHFYGKSLITEGELPRFLGRVLLLSPIVDRAWVAHQLIEGACGLRISARIINGQVPRVIREIAGNLST